MNLLTDTWYVLKLLEKRKEIMGPLTEEDLLIELRKGNISWTDLGMRPFEDRDWKRLYDIEAFQKHLPVLPTRDKLTSYAIRCRDHLDTCRPKSSTDRTAYRPVEREAVESQLPPLHGKIYLRSLAVECGPFTERDVDQAVARLGNREQVYIWYDGLRTWAPIQEVPRFSHLQYEHAIVRTGSDRTMVRALYGRETRSSERKSMVASVLLENPDGQRMFAICLDVSFSGMQVRLQNPITLMKDDELKLEIEPISTSGLSKLRCRARVVWWNSGELRLGLFFLEFEGDGKARLDHYLSSLRAAL